MFESRKSDLVSSSAVVQLPAESAIRVFPRVFDPGRGRAFESRGSVVEDVLSHGFVDRLELFDVS